MTGFKWVGQVGWVRFFARWVQAFCLLVMVVFLPASPIACAVLSGRFHFLRQYAQSVRQSAKSLRALYRADVIARNLERCMQQLLLPQLAQRHWVQGDCTHCGKCCLDSACVFLEWTDPGDQGQVQSRCSIHNNWFWKLTSCGTYPVDAQSIAVYDCQSFKAIPIRTVRTRQALAGQR